MLREINLTKFLRTTLRRALMQPVHYNTQLCNEIRETSFLAATLYHDALASLTIPFFILLAHFYDIGKCTSDCL